VTASDLQLLREVEGLEPKLIFRRGDKTWKKWAWRATQVVLCFFDFGVGWCTALDKAEPGKAVLT